MDVTALEAAGQFRDALDALDRAPDGGPYRDGAPAASLEARLHLRGRLLWRLARFDEAERALVESLGRRRTRLGDDHPDTLDTAERLAAVEHYQGRFDAADARFASVVAGLDRALGEDHLRAGVARRNRAACLRDAGDPRAAGVLAEATRTIVARAGRGAPEHVAALKVEALLLFYTGEPRLAARLAADAVDLAAACHGVDHPFTAAAELTLASAVLALDEAPRARAHARRARRAFEAAYGDHPLVGLALDREAAAHAATGAIPDALDAFRRGAAVYAATYPTLLLPAFGPLCNALIVAGRFDDVVSLADDALARPLGEDDRAYAEEVRSNALDWIAAATGERR